MNYKPELIEKVAYCGLYCANCGRFKKGSCAGCRGGGGFDRCPVRKCCVERSIATCADCAEFPEPHDCKKLNNIISKLFGLVFRSDRVGNVESLRALGLEEWVAKKALSGKP